VASETSSKTSYAWDTTVAIAWVCEEAGAPLADIGLVVAEIDNNRANLILSVTTFSELLESKFTPAQFALLMGFVKRSNVVSVNLTIPVAMKAAKIRDAGQRDGRKIKTPDAQIIATAVSHRADVLHTLDDKILALDGSPIVDGLCISRPKLITGQASLMSKPTGEPQASPAD
jgi:predicted nucleic acid-binding protein